ncbi:MocR-like pyridoxine biosynthesis transcription factor PdxR [Kurthia sibirica]|uniref:GntR family transcriptional regulator n=1 Tax=Kurthia sibirica TaxID=202750 RepID=A0A2U3AFC0_9BACL|nr:PLP-dependent aminotransferase family protein [Kurthia sibirica]PWI23252.1 GntR family transcriptional regulator [Kurthia sibirica]GEK35537.1 GntR family transcriptional regulator [Kurthia sibirica]
MDMLMFQLEKNSSIPLYEQLYKEIKKSIIEGVIPVHTKLPSKRKLAEFLMLSQTTIELAYAQLVAEGYIIAKPRIGYFVEDVEDLAYIETKKAVISSIKEPSPTIEIDFHPGHIDTASFPFTIWRKYAKDAIDFHEKDLLLIGSPQGEFSLREEIAHYLYQSRGIHCSPEQIVIGSGTEQLLPMMMKLFGDYNVYAIENPGYKLTHHIFTQYYQKTIAIDVDEDGINIHDLECTQANIAYVTPSHQFPTGAVLSASRRAQLLNWAAEKDNRFIIEDDYDSEFRYVGKPISSLQSMDHRETVIYISTFSKSLMPSLRIAFFVLPPQLLTRYNDLFTYYTSTVPRFEQHILAQFMKDGHFAKHLNRMRKIYRKKIEKLTLALSHYAPTVKISGEQAGMHIVLTVIHSQSASTLAKIALQQGIRIAPIDHYRMTPSNLVTQKKDFLLGFGGIDEQLIIPSIHRLMNAWQISRQQ